MVDLGDDNTAVGEGMSIASAAFWRGHIFEWYYSCLTKYVIVYYVSVGIVNRQDGWKYRLVGADVEVLDADMSIVASMNVMDEQGEFSLSLSSFLFEKKQETLFCWFSIIALFSNETICILLIDIYYFNFGGAIGRHLRIIQRSNNEPLNIAEVKVNKAPALATGETPYEHRYIELSGNVTSEYVTGEAHIPCGVCAIVDYENGDTVEIPRGINVEGMLYFPPTANVELRTPHLYVQGNLQIDAPNDGNKIKVHMINTGYEQFMIPHAENANQCSAVGCSFGPKAVGIAGGTFLCYYVPLITNNICLFSHSKEFCWLTLSFTLRRATYT